MNKRKNNTRIYFIGLGVLIVIAALVGGLLAYKLHRNKNTTDTTDAKTTSTAPMAQQDYTSGGDRPIASNTTDKGSAAVADSQGQQATVPDKSQWIVSKTGEITVYTPQNNQLLINGIEVTGASTLPTVNYRVIDDVSGMISQGQLTVVAGKFS